MGNKDTKGNASQTNPRFILVEPTPKYKRAPRARLYVATRPSLASGRAHIPIRLARYAAGALEDVILFVLTIQDVVKIVPVTASVAPKLCRLFGRVSPPFQAVILVVVGTTLSAIFSAAAQGYGSPSK